MAADPHRFDPAGRAGHARRSTSEGDRGGSQSRPAPARTVLLGHLGPEGGLDLLVGFAVAEGHEEAEVLLVPTPMLVEVPSLGQQMLADVVRLAGLSGPELLHTTVENALGAAFDDTLLVDDAGLAALLAPSRTMSVVLRDALRVEDAAGALALEAGRQDIDSATAMRLLATRGSEGELQHLVAVQAVIEGWFHRLRDREVAAATVGVEPEARALVVAARAVLRYDSVPVVSVATGDDEMFALRSEETRSLLERTMKWTVLGEQPRPRVEILNGTGEVGVTRSVAAYVVPEGVEVTLTGNLPGFGAAATQVVYYRGEDAATAQRIARALGVRNVARATRPVDVVDVTIVVGADLGERLRRRSSR